MPAAATQFDAFLSHASPDKPWVQTLADCLTKEGLRPFLDVQELRPAANFVLALSDGLLNSRFLVLILTPHTVNRPWVAQEWTAFMAQHGPAGRLIPVLLEAVALPAILTSVQCLLATDRDAARVARELARLIGRPGELREDDARSRFIGQGLAFVLEPAGDHLRVIDPAGRSRDVPPQADDRFGAAHFGFRQLTQQAVESDADRAELTGHAVTLGTRLFDLLFDAAGAEQLQQALAPGKGRPLLTILSRDDELLALPWELLHHDGRFLVRDGTLDVTRSTLGDVGAAALLAPPAGYFKLVVNVSAPEGSGLDYEGESYRITRALSETCTLEPTELGTLAELIETVKRVRPVGIHFSGHGGPGVLAFEDDEGRSDPVLIHTLVQRLRAQLRGWQPSFFYLASCHGNEPGSLESSAARLHREGVTQVVGYDGADCGRAVHAGRGSPVHRYRPRRSGSALAGITAIRFCPWCGEGIKVCRKK